jgi:hypothetical protein
MLQALSKPEFLTIASKLYDSRYPKLYEHYYSKGKGFALKIPQRESILGEYFAEDDAWKSYRKFSDSVRTYRNRIVHDVLIGEINAAGARLVPKKEKITSYQKLSEIFAAAGNPEKLKTDFIIMQEQMVGDYAELQTRLNVLWEKPLADMDSLFFQQRNVKLLEKYNLYLVD